MGPHHFDILRRTSCAGAAHAVQVVVQVYGYPVHHKSPQKAEVVDVRSLKTASIPSARGTCVKQVLAQLSERGFKMWTRPGSKT